jgi:16S rRNA (uracil1498-N3)-methyltransferase
MHRLLVATEILEGDSAVLPKDAMHHLKVLRPKPGESIELFDGAGRSRVFRCGSAASAPLAADGEVLFSPKAPFGLTLFACVTKGSRWDWTIEKAVELGVNRIVPVLSGRCIVRIDRSERAAKRERWQRIAEDAARQSDAKWLPEICEAVDFAESLPLVSDCACFVGALTDPPPEHLLTAARSKFAEGTNEARQYALYVGPEGDFTPAELKSLLEIATPTTFGPTILRAETAAIFGVSVLAAVLQERISDL